MSELDDGPQPASPAPLEARFTLTLDARVDSWSPEAQRLFDYEASEICGESLERLVPPERWTYQRAVIARMADGAPTTHHLSSVCRKDGDRIDVWVTMSPRRGEQHEVVGVDVLVREVSEWRRMEEAHSWLASVVEWSDDAIVSKTLDGVVTSWNRAAERLFGYRADEAIGRSITFIIPAERLSEEDEVLTRIRRGETVDHFETERVAKDGTYLQISLTVSPVRGPNGDIIGASKIARDITLQKRLEAERAELLEEAQRANHAKDEFIAMLGHELRNPLAAITAAAALLEELTGADAASRRAHGVIARQAAHLAHMVDDLLDVGRLATGKIVLDAAPVELGELARAQLETLRTAGRLDAHAVSLDDEPVWVHADAVRMEQVLANLVGNALRFTPAGRAIRVHVAAEGREAILRVEDEGAGFDPELAPTLFEVFAQGDGELDRTHGGLGIGLTLVERIAALHGGTADAASRGPGLGATFTVRLPRIAPPDASRADAAETVNHAGAAELRVLVIEDNQDAREMLSLLLQSLGYDVEEAPDGEAGLEVAAKWLPDLVLLDIGLPRVDGFEVCRRIRARVGAGPYVVALTGYGGAEDVRRAHEAGFDRHIAKPASKDELREVAARARERRDGEARARP